MGFEFTNDATDFFQRIGVKRSGAQKKKSTTGILESMLEAYWLCVQIGIKHDRYEPAEKSTEFVRSLKPLSDQADLIQGLGFYYYCKREDLLNTEKETVLDEMRGFFSEEHLQLDEAGNSLFNAYANGGFNLLFSRTGDQCRELSDLLCECYELLS